MNQNQNESNSEKVEKKHNIVYRITNQINWKYYFGIHSTANLNDNYFGSGFKLKDAIKKYGKENFVKTIIADYPTRKEASDHEKLIVTHDHVESDYCYNIKTGGDNECIMSAASRKKISIALSGNNPSEETRNKISRANKGKTRSDETKQLLSQVNLGRVVSDETRLKISVAKTGKTMPDEVKHAKSESMLGELNHFYGRHHTEETRQLISLANTGRVPSIETIKLISEANSGEKNGMYGKTHTAEAREAIRAARTGVPCSEETKEKLRNIEISRETREKLRLACLGEKNGFYGKTHSDETKLKIWQNRPFKFNIDGVLYKTIEQIMKVFQITNFFVKKRLNSTDMEWNGWNYINGNL